jgi:pyrroloquinoline quinone (PQQ) biosynthesis protein C
MDCKVLRTYKNFDRRSLDIINEVAGIIEAHELFEHKFFKDYDARRLPEACERKWLKQRHFLSKNFPSMYGNIISNSNDLEFLRPFIHHLGEEFGNGKRKNTHYYLLLDTLYAKGITTLEIDREPIAPGTQRVLSAYRKWTRHENVIIGGAIFGLGIEPIIAMDKELSLEGLRKNNTLSEQALVYFIDHASHDYWHSWQILDVALPHVKDEEDVDLIKEGVNDLLDSRVKFYDDCLSV